MSISPTENVLSIKLLLLPGLMSSSGCNAKFLSVIPVPFLDLGDCHAKLLADVDLGLVVPERVPLEVSEQHIDLKLVLLLLMAKAPLQVSVVLLLDPESGHSKVRLVLHLEVLLLKSTITDRCVQPCYLQRLRVYSVDIEDVFQTFVA